MGKFKDGIMKIFGETATPVKYSSAQTRYSSLHGFMGGAEITEINPRPIRPGYETDNNWWNMNIRSGTNQADLPTCYGLVRRGNDKIGPMIFTQDVIAKGWMRKKGEAP